MACHCHRQPSHQRCVAEHITLASAATNISPETQWAHSAARMKPSLCSAGIGKQNRKLQQGSQLRSATRQNRCRPSDAVGIQHTRWRRRCGVRTHIQWCDMCGLSALRDQLLLGSRATRLAPVACSTPTQRHAHARDPGLQGQRETPCAKRNEMATRPASAQHWAQHCLRRVQQLHAVGSLTEKKWC
jgi:hypothetical protein